MSFQVRHSWIAGAMIAGAHLASCPHCETLRVTDGGLVHFIVPGAKEVDEPGDDVRPSPGYDGPVISRRRLPLITAPPPCVAPSPFRRAPW